MQSSALLEALTELAGASVVGHSYAFNALHPGQPVPQRALFAGVCVHDEHTNRV